MLRLYFNNCVIPRLDRGIQSYKKGSAASPWTPRSSHGVTLLIALLTACTPYQVTIGEMQPTQCCGEAPEKEPERINYTANSYSQKGHGNYIYSQFRCRMNKEAKALKNDDWEDITPVQQKIVNKTKEIVPLIPKPLTKGTCSTGNASRNNVKSEWVK